MRICVVLVGAQQLRKFAFRVGDPPLMQIDHAELIFGARVAGLQLEHTVQFSFRLTELPLIEVGVGQTEMCGKIIRMLANR
jgi:hypothetical protein